MKKIFLIISLSTIRFVCLAQVENNSHLDSLIKKWMFFSIGLPEYTDYDFTGTSLLQLSFDDSVKIETLYASSSSYNFDSSNYWFSKRLTSSFISHRNEFPKNYKVIVPVYFYYFDRDKSTMTAPSKIALKEINKRIKKQKKDVNILTPLCDTIYQAIVDRRITEEPTIIRVTKPTDN